MSDPQTELMRIFFSVTEQPFKIPHYAALLRMLYDEPNPSLGKQVLDDFWDEANCSLVTCLCELLVPVVEEIRNYFSVRHLPQKRKQEVLVQLFATTDDVLQLLLKIIFWQRGRRQV